jgi:hypothetical protein
MILYIIAATSHAACYSSIVVMCNNNGYLPTSSPEVLMEMAENLVCGNLKKYVAMVARLVHGHYYYYCYYYVINNVQIKTLYLVFGYCLTNLDGCWLLLIFTLFRGFSEFTLNYFPMKWLMRKKLLYRRKIKNLALCIFPSHKIKM